MILNVTDKKKPHYALKTLKALFRKEETRMVTKMAQKGAASEGYMTIEDIEEVVERLRPEHFYKSMTQHQNHRVWQDVYRIYDGEKALYIKLQLSADGKKAVLIQMKRDEGSDE